MSGFIWLRRRGNLEALTEEFSQVEGDGRRPEGVVYDGGVGGLIEMPSEVTTDTVIDVVLVAKTDSGRNLGDDQQKHCREGWQEHQFGHRQGRTHTKFLAGPEFSIDKQWLCDGWKEEYNNQNK